MDFKTFVTEERRRRHPWLFVEKAKGKGRGYHKPHRGRPGKRGGSLPRKAGSGNGLISTAEAARAKRKTLGFRRGTSLRWDKSAQDFLLKQIPKAAKISVPTWGPRKGNVIIEDRAGNELSLVIFEGRYRGKIELNGAFADVKGTGLGTAAMKALKNYADLQDKVLIVGMVANQKFFRRFPFLKETHGGLQFEYVPHYRK